MTELDLEAIKKAHPNPPLCNVCTGWSPVWDGHDVNPPCRGYLWESIPKMVDELVRLRATVEQIEALEHPESE